MKKWYLVFDIEKGRYLTEKEVHEAIIALPINKDGFVFTPDNWRIGFTADEEDAKKLNGIEI